MSPPVRSGPTRTSGVHREQTHEAQSPSPDRRPGDAADRARSACRRWRPLGQPQARPALGGHQLREAQGPATGGNPARPRRHPPDPRRHGACPGQGIAPSGGRTCAATSPRAIDASGLRPMLKTADLDLDEVWTRLLAPADQRIRHGLSRFARWASLRRITPEAVDDSTIDRFIAELDGATLIRNLRNLRRHRREAWNALVGAASGRWAAAGCGADQQACADPDSLAATSSLVPRGCRALPHLGGRAGPARRGRSGKGPRAAEPAPAANSHPFGRECGGCGRHSRSISSPLWRASSNPKPSARCCAIAGGRTDASCRPTPTVLPSR